MTTAREYKTEADLCTAFTEWACGVRGIRCYAEWAGWDILLVLPDGYQIGIEAKLRLNAEVIGQALPSRYGCDDHGPDFRGILVPGFGRTPLGVIAESVGLIVFYPSPWRGGFTPKLNGRDYSDGYEGGWVDWNPRQRYELPPGTTDAIAGSPCPVTLTPWKLAALDVLADLEVKGTITTKRMKELGINPSRWLSNFWLMPGDVRGLWVRGDRCPKFDEQHPTAYALALEKARAAA